MNIVSAATLNASNASQAFIPSCLMMTSKVRLQGPNGRSMIARALLDSGSSVSMLSNQVAQTLQLPKQATSISFSGAQDTPLQGAKYLTSVDLCTTLSSDPITSLTTAIVPRVTCNLPLQGAPHVRNMPHLFSNPSRPNFPLTRANRHFIGLRCNPLCYGTRACLRS